MVSLRFLPQAVPVREQSVGEHGEYRLAVPGVIKALMVRWGLPSAFRVMCRSYREYNGSMVLRDSRDARRRVIADYRDYRQTGLLPHYVLRMMLPDKKKALAS